MYSALSPPAVEGLFRAMAVAKPTVAPHAAPGPHWSPGLLLTVSVTIVPTVVAAATVNL